MLARFLVRAVDLARQRTIEDFVDQRRLAAAGNPRHHRQHAERDGDIQVLQVVLAGAVDAQLVLAGRTPFPRHRNFKRARKVLAGERLRIAGDCRRISGGHQEPSQAAGAGTEIDHIVGARNGFGVVLHHQHRVAHVAQMRQRLEQPAVVAWVQADRRLVQHVQHAAQFRADLRGQANALRFTAGKRGRGTIQADVIQAHRGKKLEAPADFIQHAAGDLHLALAEFPVPHRHQRARDRQRGEFRDREILHLHRQAGRPQPLAAARVTFHRRHVFGQPFAVAFRRTFVGLL